jgi:hypothetical protein
MALGLVLGLILVGVGLLLMCHLSYTSLCEKGGADCEKLAAEGRDPPKNDCFVPCLFFQVGRVTNHETWIVACLLSGATVLWVSMV